MSKEQHHNYSVQDFLSGALLALVEASGGPVTLTREELIDAIVALRNGIKHIRLDASTEIAEVSVHEGSAHDSSNIPAA